MPCLSFTREISEISALSNVPQLSEQATGGYREAQERRQQSRFLA